MVILYNRVAKTIRVAVCKCLCQGKCTRYTVHLKAV